jgi:hypothetical protein
MEKTWKVRCRSLAAWDLRKGQDWPEVRESIPAQLCPPTRFAPRDRMSCVKPLTAVVASLPISPREAGPPPPPLLAQDFLVFHPDGGNVTLHRLSPRELVA